MLFVQFFVLYSIVFILENNCKMKNIYWYAGKFFNPGQPLSLPVWWSHITYSYSKNIARNTDNSASINHNATCLRQALVEWAAGIPHPSRPRHQCREVK